MKHTYLLSAIAAVALIVGAGTVGAQTNPTPYTLSSGNYSLTSWAASSSAGTYPTGMVYHTFLDRIEPFAGAYTQAPNGNWALAYNLTSGPRINGRDASGIEFTQTGTAQSGNCSFVGAAILAVNTQGRAGIRLTWYGKTVSIQPRPYVLRLQWRTNTANAWTDAVDYSGSRVEHSSQTNGTSPVAHVFDLPASLENQVLVQFRWLYFQDGNGSGNRPSIQLDDISVTSTDIAGTATNLWITSLTPSNPSVNTPFTVRVRSTDNTGAPKNLTTSTTVTLSRVGGTGTLSGTLVGSIPAGSSSIDFTNVSYNTIEGGVSIQAAASGGQALTSFTTPTFSVGGGASYAITTDAPTNAYAGVLMSPFTVTVYKADNTVDENYATNMTITKTAGGGTLSGTTVVAPYRGVAMFDNLFLSATGSVTLQITIPGLTAQTLNITVNSAPTLATNIVPQYVASRTPSGTCSFNNFPIPSYAHVTFNNLQPNTTYRYNTGGIEAQPLTSTGGGFNIHYNAMTNTYVYSASKSLTTDGSYSTFSTGSGQTSKSIWINLVPTNATAFTELAPVYWRVALGDNGGNLINYYQLSLTSTAINMGNVSNQSTLVGERTSTLTPLDYVLVYDNTAGTGRPVGVSIVQSYNTSVTGATNRYRFDIENIDGAWMVQVPNTQSTGIRRIEVRNYSTNAVTYAVTSTDGKWNGISTYPSDATQYPSGPGGFSTPIYLETPRVVVTSPAANDTLCSGNMQNIVYRADGMDSVKLEYSTNNGVSWELIATDVPVSGGVNNPNNGSYSWLVPGVGLNPTNFMVRVTGVDRPDVNGVSGVFTVVEPLSIVLDLKSKNMCLDDTDTLLIITSGSIKRYQWYKDGVALPTNNFAVYYLTDAQYGTGGVYTVKVFGYGGCGDVMSGPAHVRVARPTEIVNQSFAVPGILGSTATLWVEAEVPDEAISYQWYRGQSALVDDGHYYGTSTNKLEIRNFMNSDYGNDYYCVVTGVCGTAQSRVIRVFPTGVFAEFRSDEFSACQGQNVTLDADVYSNPAGEALVMKWYRNGVALQEGNKYSGTATETLTISNVTTADAGAYEIKATMVLDPNANSTATANVVIATMPQITRQPASADVCENESASIGLTADAQGSVTYQWYKDGTAIIGANTPDYMIQNMTAARAGEYYCQITTACGSVSSDTIDVAMKASTQITTQPPATLSVMESDPLSISVDATGAGTVQYQWFKDGAAITGEVAPTFSKTALMADAGSYWCVVTGECGPVTSDTTVVTITPFVSVKDELAANGIHVSLVAPNPASNAVTITITLPFETPVQFNLVDASGTYVDRVVTTSLPAGTHTLPVNVSNLGSGMYALQTVVNGLMNVQTLVVVR